MSIFSLTSFSSFFFFEFQKLYQTNTKFSDNKVGLKDFLLLRTCCQHENQSRGIFTDSCPALEPAPVGREVLHTHYVRGASSPTEEARPQCKCKFGQFKTTGRGRSLTKPLLTVNWSYLGLSRNAGPMLVYQSFKEVVNLVFM